MTDIFDAPSLPERIEEILRPVIGEKLAELAGMPAFLAAELVDVDIDGPHAPEEEGSEYFTAEIYIDHPLFVNGRDLAQEIKTTLEDHETVEVGDHVYFLNNAEIFLHHREEFEEALDAIDDGLSALFNDESAPQIWVETDKTADRNDVLIVDATRGDEIPPDIREKAAAVIAKALEGMEDRPEIRCEGDFPELRIVPRWTI